MHQRSDDDTEDDRHQDDGQAPVAAEGIEEMDNVINKILDDVPHVSVSSYYT